MLVGDLRLLPVVVLAAVLLLVLLTLLTAGSDPVQFECCVAFRGLP